MDAIVECRQPQRACAMHLQLHCSYEFLLCSSSTTRQAIMISTSKLPQFVLQRYSTVMLGWPTVRHRHELAAIGATAGSVLVMKLVVTSFAHCSNGLFRHERRSRKIRSRELRPISCAVALRHQTSGFQNYVRQNPSCYADVIKHFSCTAQRLKPKRSTCKEKASTSMMQIGVHQNSRRHFCLKRG